MLKKKTATPSDIAIGYLFVGHLSKIAVTEYEEQAIQQEEAGWIRILGCSSPFNPEKMMYVLGRIKGDPKADRLKDLSELINGYMCDYQVSFAERDRLHREIFREWLKLKRRAREGKRKLSK